MDGITILLYVMAVIVFITACLVRHYGVRFLSILLSAVSLLALMIDDTITTDWLILLLIVDFFMVGMGAAFVIDLGDSKK